MDKRKKRIGFQRNHQCQKLKTAGVSKEKRVAVDPKGRRTQRNAVLQRGL